MTSGTIDQVFQDDTLPDGPHQKRITFKAPFTRCNREQDYRTVWTEFEKRFGDDSRPLHEKRKIDQKHHLSPGE